MKKKLISTFSLLVFCLSSNGIAESNQFSNFLKPLFEKNCNECHGKKKTKGKINLYELNTFGKLLDKPDVIKEVIEAIDAGDMPPEDEPQLSKQVKTKLILVLKEVLQQSTGDQKIKEVAFKRLNRFQYNNTVKDLFKMNRDIFALPEKLMTRRSNYLINNKGVMPESVDVYNASLKQGGGLKGVGSFPQDLRANHGFDNQSDQLNMAPLLLDAFLKLSISIVDSPDFNNRNVGLWQEFFLEPRSSSGLNVEIKKRLKPFLTKAFRSPVDQATVERYTHYTMAKIKGGLSFTEAMKKVASATLASPLFLHSFISIDPQKRDFNLASKLSYFLWGSAPDETLLSLAASGKLTQKGNLEKSVDRMLKDPKIERFLDSFPAQWMQLESLFSAQPDPKVYRNYSIDKNKPVSTHMVLEPLLLFDTVFVENRPLMDLIKPDFSYQNEFLKKWYSQNDKTVDKALLAREDKKSIDARIKLRQKFQSDLDRATKETARILKSYKVELPKKSKRVKFTGKLSKIAKEDQKKIIKNKKAIAISTKNLKKFPLFNDKTIILDRRNRADMAMRRTLKSQSFKRTPASDPRYGGIITNAAMLTMTSAPLRTQPITRGSWIIEVVLNDPPPPPPNDVPPLDEERLDKNMTIKESFAQHRKNPDCAGCHSKLDPLGFVMENFDGVGLWRDQYKNRRKVDPTGTLLKKYPYKNIVDFKDSLAKEKERFAKAFIRHLLRFALTRKLSAGEALLIDDIAAKTKKSGYAIKSIIKEVILSESFIGTNRASASISR